MADLTRLMKLPNGPVHMIGPGPDADNPNRGRFTAKLWSETHTLCGKPLAGIPVRNQTMWGPRVTCEKCRKARGSKE